MPMEVDVALDTHCFSDGLFVAIGVEGGIGEGVRREGRVCAEDCFFSFFDVDFFLSVGLIVCSWRSVCSRFFTLVAVLDVVIMAALLACFDFFVAFLLGNEDLCFSSVDEFAFFNEVFLLPLIASDERVFFFCTLSTSASFSWCSTFLDDTGFLDEEDLVFLLDFSGTGSICFGFVGILPSSDLEVLVGICYCTIIEEKKGGEREKKSQEHISSVCSRHSGTIYACHKPACLFVYNKHLNC